MGTGFTGMGVDPGSAGFGHMRRCRDWPSGPAARVGHFNHITGDGALPCLIRFENLSTATAPAYEVRHSGLPPAARGGMGIRRNRGQPWQCSNYDDLDRLARKCAWFAGNSGGRTHEVGGLEANGFGLFDMNGNVCECAKTSSIHPRTDCERRVVALGLRRD